MKTYQLKKLIREVIREVEKDIEEPSKSPEKDDGFGKHSREHEKQYGALGDVTVTLKLGGLKKNSSHIVKDFIAQAAWAAKNERFGNPQCRNRKGWSIGVIN